MWIRNVASLWQHYHFITLLCFRAGLLRLENAAGQLFHSFDKRCRPARSTGTGLFQESLNVVILIFLCEKSPPVQTAFKNQRKLRFLAAGFEQGVSLLQAKTVPGARPAIIPRMFYLGKNTNRIALNIPNAGKQIRSVQGTGKETTLKEKAPNPIAKINHAGIEAMGLSYGTGKTLLLLRDNTKWTWLSIRQYDTTCRPNRSHCSRMSRRYSNRSSSEKKTSSERTPRWVTDGDIPGPLPLPFAP